MDSELELELASLVTQIIFVARSTDWQSKREREIVSLLTQILHVCSKHMDWDPDMSRLNKVFDLEKQIASLKPKLEILSVTHRIKRLPFYGINHSEWPDVLYIMSRIIFLVSSMDLDSEESDLVSLVKQILSFSNSKPDSESEFVPLIKQLMHLDISVVSDSERAKESELLSLISQLVSFKPESELTSFVKQIVSCFISMKWEPELLISLSPQAMVKFEKGKLCATGDEVQRRKKKAGECSFELLFLGHLGKDYFCCRDCNGEDHEEDYDKAPVEVRHPLHPKHSLRLVSLTENDDYTSRKCYCCDEDLKEIFYYCSACDYAMNVACAEKPPPLLSIDKSKWHEHTLVLFPRHTPLTCDVCAMTDTRCSFYICPPCDFIVHQNCLSLPRVLRISRHPHRLSFVSFFNKGDWFCSVCRRKIDSNYGGYSCIKDNCLYTAHSRCATQRNVWDGEELEGVPEEAEEELQPFVRISQGIIQHFSHQQHHLKLNENTGNGYDENKICQACITPIYFGNFYSCMECEFIIHEPCANLSPRIYHPIHPHMLTLVTEYCGRIEFDVTTCIVCPRLRTGFFYECHKEECPHFKLHVQCATVSEPVVHESHTHPLFLTSKPGEVGRTCGVCKDPSTVYTEETFNCIECDYSVCFACATIPQKVRYKHDKHILTLSYGKKTSTVKYWCEACETKINQEEGFYKCDEYCCLTFHIKCLIGKDFYMKPGLLLFEGDTGADINVLPNNHHVSRPFCSKCKKRCPQKITFECFGLTFCSGSCVIQYTWEILQQR